MKFLLIILLLSKTAFATTYYVKNAGGTGNGTSDATAWSPAKYRSSYQSIQAGDNVYFNRGETFTGAFPITDNPGNASNYITIGAYGTGAKPIFTGLTTLTTWTAHSTIPNVYYATVDVPRLEIVTLDGNLVSMGRYPKSSYLTLQSHSALSSITSTSASSIPFNPAGAEVVIKKAMYIIDRHLCTSRSGSTINISSPTDFGQTTDNGISDGNGYFIQGHIGTLTQLGDWYYDVSAKRLYMHFGTGTYATHTIQAATSQIAFDGGGKSYLKFRDLDIRGYNLSALNTYYADHIDIKNLDLTRCNEGISSLQGAGVTTVDSCNISSMYSTGISTFQTDYYTVKNTNVRDIHLVQGMGKSGDQVGSGISVDGNTNLTITGNTVRNVGYCGIAWAGGNHLLIEKNLIDTFELNKNDGGGVYGFGNFDQEYVDRIIRNNIILHGIGNIEGVSSDLADGPFAIGLYLDDYTSNVNAYNNFVYSTTGPAVFNHSNRNDTIENNIFFANNHKMSFHQIHQIIGDGGGVITGMVVRNNHFITSSSDEVLMNFEQYEPNSNIASMGTYDYNTFYRPFGSSSFIRIDNRENNGQIVTNYTLPQWRTNQSKEVHSTISSVPISGVSDFRVEYNATPAQVTRSLPGIYKTVSNGTYPGSVIFDPYLGDVFIFSAALLNNPVWTLQINLRKIVTTP